MKLIKFDKYELNVYEKSEYNFELFNQILFADVSHSGSAEDYDQVYNVIVDLSLTEEQIFKELMKQKYFGERFIIFGAE